MKDRFVSRAGEFSLTMPDGSRRTGEGPAEALGRRSERRYRGASQLVREGHSVPSERHRGGTA